MAVTVVSEFIAKETVRTRVHIYDDDDALVEPTSVLITLTDPDGDVEVDEEEIVVTGKQEDGVYDHFYNTTVDSVEGWWLGEAVITDGSGDGAKTTACPFSFKVK